MSEFTEKRIAFLRAVMRVAENYNWQPDAGRWRSMSDDLSTLQQIDDWVERQAWDGWRVVPSADDIMTQVIDGGREPLRGRDDYDWAQDQVCDMLEEMRIPVTRIEED